MEERKRLKLQADPPFYNSVDVAIFDFPEGEAGRQRQRCKITVEFAESDVRLLQKEGMDFAQAMDYYEKWLYRVVKTHIAQDWEAVDGYAQIMGLIRERVGKYYTEQAVPAETGRTDRI